MNNPLISYLNTQLTDDYVFINDILKSHDEYKSKSSDQLRQYLIRLVLDGMIDVKDNAHDRLGHNTLLNATDFKNTMTDLDNWPMCARITDYGKEKTITNKKFWYDTENARRQFEDYPKTEQRANAALLISIISVVITIILGILQLLS